MPPWEHCANKIFINIRLTDGCIGGFNITPSTLGKSTRDEIMPWFSDVKEGDNLAYIPFDNIIGHLKKLSNVYGNPMYGVLKFPKELQEEFDKHKIKYLTRDL